jgi:hypothetical protein
MPALPFIPVHFGKRALSPLSLSRVRDNPNTRVFPSIPGVQPFPCPSDRLDHSRSAPQKRPQSVTPCEDWRNAPHLYLAARMRQGSSKYRYVRKADFGTRSERLGSSVEFHILRRTSAYVAEG